jgi:hypothetical protein
MGIHSTLVLRSIIIYYIFHLKNVLQFNNRNTMHFTVSTPNTEIMEGFQSKDFRMIVEHICSCRIRLSERISIHQQLKKKSVSTALKTVRASVYTHTT